MYDVLSSVLRSLSGPPEAAHSVSSQREKKEIKSHTWSSLSDLRSAAANTALNQRGERNEDSKESTTSVHIGPRQGSGPWGTRDAPEPIICSTTGRQDDSKEAILWAETDTQTLTGFIIHTHSSTRRQIHTHGPDSSVSTDTGLQLSLAQNTGSRGELLAQASVFPGFKHWTTEWVDRPGMWNQFCWVQARRRWGLKNDSHLQK